MLANAGKERVVDKQENLLQSRTYLVQGMVDVKDNVRAIETDEEQQRE